MRYSRNDYATFIEIHVVILKAVLNLTSRELKSLFMTVGVPLACKKMETGYEYILH